MKTLIVTETKESIYLFHDENDAVVTDEGFMFDGLSVNPEMNSQTAVIVNCNQPPDDWVGSKYIYDNDQWTLNELRPDL
jgi:hypothetical protein